MPYHRIILSQKQIDQIVTQLSREIACCLGQEENWLALVVLEGAHYFARDLLAKLEMPIEVEYIKASSYSGTQSTGTVRMHEDPVLIEKICNRNILLVDDIYDTGLTMSRILTWLEACHSKSVRTCVLLEKDIRHAHEIPIDFLGTKIENEFLIGYGLDHNDQYRELPFIGVLSKEEIAR